MATIQILGGDIPSGKWAFSNGIMAQGFTNSINLATSVKTVELQTEEKLKKLGGSAGWGFTGAIIGGLAGPLGALAGLAGGVMAGGNKTEICFACELTNEKKFVAITDVKTYQIILGYSFNPKDIKPTLELYIPSEETLEIFKQQITEFLDAEQTSCTLKREPGGWIFTLTIKNKTRFSKEEQVELIKKAIEKTQFEGRVSIRVNKVFPNHTHDKEWKTILNYNNKQITESRDLSKLPDQLVLVVLGFVILFAISHSISDAFKKFQQTTIPKPTVTETNRTP